MRIKSKYKELNRYEKEDNWTGYLHQTQSLWGNFSLQPDVVNLWYFKQWILRWDEEYEMRFCGKPSYSFKRKRKQIGLSKVQKE